MRNEENNIGDCLKSILAQDFSDEGLEVLVLDGMSTDSSWQIAEGILGSRENCRLLRNPRMIQSAAWNLGIEESRGRLIGILSGHVALAPNYVRKVIETVERTGADMVGGPVMAIGEGRVAEAIALAMSNRFGVGGQTARYATKEIYVDSVFQGVCRRETFARIGGFDEEMVRNQDDELSYRLLEHGGRILCNPEIRCSYRSRSTFRGLWKQYYEYGFWKVRVLQKHPRQMRPRQFAPPLFVLSLIFCLCLTALLRWGWLTLVSVGGCYALANLGASLLTAAKKGWKHFPFLPLAYAILHLRYGLGFLVGLIKFWNRWGDKKGRVPEFKSLGVQEFRSSGVQE
jgi:glycosyltransferase involved in cell wall biosynthesis